MWILKIPELLEHLMEFIASNSWKFVYYLEYSKFM